MSQSFVDTRATLYIDALQSQSLHDRSLEEAILDITLANILSNPASITQDDSNLTSSSDSAEVLQKYRCFQKNELLMFGTPVRRHLNPSTRQRLLEEINDVLSSITEFLHGARPEENNAFYTLPEDIQKLKDGIQSKQQEINQHFQRIIDQIFEISQIREILENGVKQAISITFPAYDAARSASIDLLLTTIETTLIKLSLIRARSERALYNHKPNDDIDNSRTVSRALSLAFKSLKKDERDMKAEYHLLDQQLHEYEMLLQLVDGGESTGGYRQVVNDWTKVKQETDECKRDLRRLGWSGD